MVIVLLLVLKADLVAVVGVAGFLADVRVAAVMLMLFVVAALGFVDSRGFFASGSVLSFEDSWNGEALNNKQTICL